LSRGPTFMDMQIPDRQFGRRPAAMSAAFLQGLRRALAAAMPADAGDTGAAMTLELFESLSPRDPAEAQLAAIAVAAALAAMDGFARAARPGVTDETAVRLRGSALAAGRSYATVLRTLRKDTAKPAAAPPPEADAAPPPVAVPAQEPDEFQPRDRFGKPIPTRRTDLMTRAQVLAVLAYPRNPELEAAAVAEEEEAIAAHAPPPQPAGVHDKEGRDPEG
jgi:hypothetical protein